jgi:hypothetical protein
MTISSEEFDKLVDDNEQDIIEHLDLASARRPGRDVRRVNVDLPTWMIDSLDVEAARVGVTRQSIIKMWLADRLDRTEN